ncbi:hypothetical protein A4G20_03100 [Pasteurellaceae bacterium RH1A]|nr:hypothetical protein A4G20_03100 [Pasteurellaceae bacterium RH1A]
MKYENAVFYAKANDYSNNKRAIFGKILQLSFRRKGDEDKLDTDRVGFAQLGSNPIKVAIF